MTSCACGKPNCGVQDARFVICWTATGKYYNGLAGNFELPLDNATAYASFDAAERVRVENNFKNSKVIPR